MNRQNFKPQDSKITQQLAVKLHNEQSEAPTPFGSLKDINEANHLVGEYEANQIADR